MADNIVNADFLAKFFRADIDQVRAWGRNGMPKESKDKFNFIKCVDWRLKKLEKEIEQRRYLTRKELSKILGFNDKYINELEREYGLPKETWNKYDINKMIPWLMEYKDTIHKKNIEKIKSDKPQDVLAIKSAEYKDLLIREKRGELVPATAVEDAWVNEISVINAELDSFPIKAAPNLLGVKTVKKMKDKLIIEINKIKTKIAKLKLHTAGPKRTK